MAKRIDQALLDSYDMWEFTEEERTAASLLSELQLQKLITLRAIVAKRKLALVFDVENAASLNRDSAWLQAQHELLTELISDHVVALAKVATIE